MNNKENEKMSFRDIIREFSEFMNANNEPPKFDISDMYAPFEIPPDAGEFKGFFRVALFEKGQLFSAQFKDDDFIFALSKLMAERPEFEQHIERAQMLLMVAKISSQISAKKSGESDSFDLSNVSKDHTFFKLQKKYSNCFQIILRMLKA